ncbi:hypothetical protein [Catalinimonas niigatensis]|uniref:hypothetical protein n=1 Tax=Catalinimonas niigatensis TaxID=1397264 RepID=UPI002666E7DB|nr:hypothetical protein [Catalinimonas niigatensis]WPP48450.1 hypothetical protein PZB72_17395 [Catalinimonas niigatensis]
MHYLKISLTAFLLFLMGSHDPSFTEGYYASVSDHGKKFIALKDDQPQRNVSGKAAVIPCHPLLLNGKAFDDKNFDIHSQGILTLLEGSTDASESKLIPFRVSRKRNGVLLEEHAGATLEGEYEIDVSLLLAHSYPGDQLIIYPIKKEHCRAKRVLRITSENC